MEHFIGKTLQECINELTKMGLSYRVVENNHNVVGDNKLVTNAKRQNDIVILTVGEFIFNLKG